MAGVGLELRRALLRDGYFGILRAYGLAGILSAGPWVLSLLGMTLLELLWRWRGLPALTFEHFKVCVTHLFASSLIVSGALHFLLARFCADRVYEGRPERVLPNLIGALALMTPIAGALSALALEVLGPAGPERSLLVASFVALCDLWTVVVMLSALRRTGSLLLCFALSHGTICAAALLLGRSGLPGLLLAFFLGHALLLLLLLGLVEHAYPGSLDPAFEFLSRRQAFPDLALCGLIYNLSVWADRIMFWIHPSLGVTVLGPFRAAPAYDAPATLAYLCMIPGMAVFLLRIETDFVEIHERFYRAVSDGAPLARIEALRNGLVISIRRAIGEILKVQGLCALALIVSGPALLSALGIPAGQEQLFRREVLGVSILVLFLSVVHLLLYFDLRREGLVACVLMLVLCTGFTRLGQELGPGCYGIGLPAAALLSALAGLALLGRRLDRLEYETYMLQ